VLLSVSFLKVVEHDTYVSITYVCSNISASKMSGFDFPENIAFNIIKSFSFSIDVFLLFSGAFIYTVVVSAVSADAVAETTTTKTTNNTNNRNMTVVGFSLFYRKVSLFYIK
jgi:hypothetical protein